MSIGRCDWLLQEGQWIFGYLLFPLSSRFSAILTFPLCVIHLWSPTHNHSLISSHLLQPSAFYYGLKNMFNCNCNVLQRLVFFFFLSCSSERWINATGVVPAQSLFTAGKEMHVWYESDFSSLSPHLQQTCFCSSRSDGTSRTGTYILIDMVLNRMAKGEDSPAGSVLMVIIRLLPFTSPTISCFVFTGVKEIDIAAALEHIRDQRPGLVRTKVPAVCVSVLSEYFWHGVPSWSSPSPLLLRTSLSSPWRLSLRRWTPS